MPTLKNTKGRKATESGAKKTRRRVAKSNIPDDPLAAAAAAKPTSKIDFDVDEELFQPVSRHEAGGLHNNAEIRKARDAKPLVTVEHDESQNVILKRIAEAESETPELQTNPLRETVEQLRPLLPNEGRGMRFKACSPRITARKGRRNWEPLLHPTTGQEIIVQGLTLCWMPAISAARRNRHFQEIGNEQIREAQANFKQNANDIVRAAERQGVVGLSVLNDGDVLQSNDDRDNRLEHYGHREAIGVSTTRGELRGAPKRGRQQPVMTPEMEAMVQHEITRRLEAMDNTDYQPGEFAGLGREQAAG